MSARESRGCEGRKTEVRRGEKEGQDKKGNKMGRGEGIKNKVEEMRLEGKEVRVRENKRDEMKRERKR